MIDAIVYVLPLLSHLGIKLCDCSFTPETENNDCVATHNGVIISFPQGPETGQLTGQQ